MKISVNDLELFSLSEIQKQVIQNDICSDDFDADMKRRLEYVLIHKYEQCFKRLKEEWGPKLAERYPLLPSSKEAFAELVFKQPDYRNKTAQNKES